MLLDSGAQVTMVSRAWIEKNIPHIKIKPLESLLSDQPLEIAAANGTDVPFDGWADTELQIQSVNYGHVAIQVPVLISQHNLNCLILGSNVIAEILKTNKEQRGGADLSALLKEALSVSSSAVDALVSALQMPTPDEIDPECSVRTGKKGVMIPAGQICEVKCRVREWPRGGPRLFQPNLENSCPEGLELFPALVDVPSGLTKIVKIPIQNPTKHDIFLSKRTVLGTLEEVTEVKPVKYLSADAGSSAHTNVKVCSVQLGNGKHQTEVNEGQRWHPPVDLSYLTEGS